jgi:hypothetical protein
MSTFTKEQIKEISDQLDFGSRAFYHKITRDLIFVPNTDKHFDMDTSAWQDELDKLDESFFEYREIEAMESNDSFRVMNDFAEQLSDIKLRDKLIQALNRNKPFREFKFVIDNSPEHRQSWFDFKNKRYIKWTEEQVEILEKFNELRNASR